MSKPVTSKQLVETLAALGFELDRQIGSHLLLKHDGTGAVLTLPQSTKPLRPIFVNTAARQVANSGIATVESFNRKLESAGQQLGLKKGPRPTGKVKTRTKAIGKPTTVGTAKRNIAKA